MGTAGSMWIVVVDAEQANNVESVVVNDDADT